jgi:hypothetical protein
MTRGFPLGCAGGDAPTSPPTSVPSPGQCSGGTVRIGDYPNGTERLFFPSLMVGSFQVREDQEQRQEGVLGVRAVLSHGDLLEALEFVVPAAMKSRREHTKFTGSRRIASSCVVGTTPRITQVFRTFPSHVHIGPSDRVESSQMP